MLSLDLSFVLSKSLLICYLDHSPIAIELSLSFFTKAILPRVVHSYHDHLVLECSGLGRMQLLVSFSTNSQDCTSVFIIHAVRPVQFKVSFIKE